MRDGPAGVAGLAGRALGLSRGRAGAWGAAGAGIAVTPRCWSGGWVGAAHG